MAGDAHQIIEETVTLKAADGFSLEGFRARPSQGSKGGLVVLQEIFGLTDQMKGVVRSYARDGYDAIFPCVFDRAAPRTVVPFNEPERGRDLAYGLAMDKVVLDIAAAVEHVKSDRGVSVLGFCWGGGVLVRAAAEVELRGAVSFYGTRLPSYLGQAVKCPMQFHFGVTDPNTPPETIDAVRRAIPSSEIWTYPAGHAFANDARSTYVPEAAETARVRTLEFLRKHHEPRAR
jgi:carboxymethylenebutenolidase